LEIQYPFFGQGIQFLLKISFIFVGSEESQNEISLLQVEQELNPLQTINIEIIQTINANINK